MVNATREVIDQGEKRDYVPLFHRPYGSVGVGRTLPPQMNAAMRGCGAAGASPCAITIPRNGPRTRGSRFPSSRPVFISLASFGNRSNLGVEWTHDTAR